MAQALSDLESASSEPPADAPAQLHASFLACVQERRSDPNWSSYKAHTDRWDRVLLALGERVLDASLSPMTAAEADGHYVLDGWAPWEEVAYLLENVKTGSRLDDTLTGAGELLVDLDGGDALTGGAGRDRFVFVFGDTGAKVITDFATGDAIVLKGTGWSSAADIIAAVRALGGYRYPLASGLTVDTSNNPSLRTEDFITEV